MFEMTGEPSLTPPERILIAGLGRAGCRIANRVAALLGSELTVAAIGSDAGSLHESTAAIRLQLGKNSLKGMGAGGKPEAAQAAAKADYDLLTGLFSNADVAFIFAGLGKGTGSGAITAVAEAAGEAGALTVCLVTLPFRFEGDECREKSDRAMKSLLDAADIVVVLPNENLVSIEEGNVTLKNAFARSDEVIVSGVYALYRLMSRDSLITLDRSELQAMSLKTSGVFSMGYGFASGRDKARVAAREAVICPMLGEEKVSSAAVLFVSIVGGSALSLRQIGDIVSEVKRASHARARLLVGVALEQDAKEDISVTILSAEDWGGSSTPAKQAEPATQSAARGKTTRRKRSQVTQPDLGLLVSGRGRFKDVEPTIMDGEDLDVPTFVRRGIKIDR
jgi:cell division protein FtsZ